jgi:hypothetical protein
MQLSDLAQHDEGQTIGTTPNRLFRSFSAGYFKHRLRLHSLEER